MEDIDIFDINEGFWYKQQAVGTIPETRRLFCAGAGSAKDGSSHNVYVAYHTDSLHMQKQIELTLIYYHHSYLYGGAATRDKSIGYGDVYILTMPNFQWIKWWPQDPKERTAPHNSLTCNVVKGHQMLIMGGYFPGQDACDVPLGFGVHNMDMSAYNGQNTLWVGYTKQAEEYLVPKSVVDLVGGG